MERKNRGFTPLETIGRQKKDKRSLTGFTLLEIMIAVGIFSFMSIAMYGVLATARRSWLTGEALLTAKENAQGGLDKIIGELRLASLATVGADNRTVAFSIPFDADEDGSLDLIAGTSSLVYGADDPQDFNNNGILWESGWRIEYQIDTVNNQIIRRVLDNTSAVADQRMVAERINPASTLTFFQTETGGSGVTSEAVIISLTTRINTIQGMTINPSLQTTVKSRVELRN
jgi:prepilin-type N-terminal cleavage/methylation domain-containing protein